MPLSVAILGLITAALLFVIWDVQRITRRRDTEESFSDRLDLDFSEATFEWPSERVVGPEGRERL